MRGPSSITLRTAHYKLGLVCDLCLVVPPQQWTLSANMGMSIVLAKVFTVSFLEAGFNGKHSLFLSP